MKARAIQLTAALMIITLSTFATGKTSKSNDGNVWTAMTLVGKNYVEIRMTKPADVVVTLNVYNETHQKVYSKRIRKETDLILSHNIANFPNGVYTYQIKEGKNVVSEKSIVKSSGEMLQYLPDENLADAAGTK